MSIFNFSRDIDADEPIKYQAKCETCNCYIDRINQVTVYGFQQEEVYYCNTHKKPYNKILKSIFYDSPVVYFAELQVNENGEPVGYTKKK